MNQHESLLVGIDGGGTKTVALVSDLEGRVLGRGAGGPSNYQAVGLPVACDSMNQAIRAGFADAKIEPCLPRVICLGLAGVDRPQDYAAIRAWAAEQMPGTPAVIVNDARPGRRDTRKLGDRDDQRDRLNRLWTQPGWAHDPCGRMGVPLGR